MENTTGDNPPGTDLRDEALRRAKKKYKKRRSDSSPDRGMMEETGVPARPPSSPSANAPSKFVSYRDRVTGNFEEEDSTWEEWTEDAEGDDCIMFDDSVSDEEDGAPSDSHVKFTPDEKRLLRKPWRKSLIVKLLGKVLGFKALSAKIKTLWQIKGKYKIIDLGNDYFLFKFQHKSDYTHALDGGPWIIGGHYLTVRQWKHNFQPDSDKINSIIAWIRLPQLPLEYYPNMAVRRIASTVGRVIRLDKTTETVDRGGFARVCVDLDLTAPLKSFVHIGDLIQRVEYEGLHLICFSCGQFGHRKDACSMSPTMSSTSVDGSEPSGGNSASSQNPDVSSSTPGFGPWMIVQRKVRRLVKETVEKGKNKIDLNPGHNLRNRFSSLSGIEDSSRENFKEPVSAVSKEKFKESVGYGQKVWKPKKDLGLTEQTKSSNKGKPKVGIKKSVPPPVVRSDGSSFIWFGRNLCNGPPPGFSFKAGSNTQITLDPKRLEELVGSSHFGLSHLMAQQNSTTAADTGVSGESVSAMVVGDIRCGDEMILPTDAVCLPPQQPPSVVVEQANSALIQKVNDASDEKDVSTMDAAQSKELVHKPSIFAIVEPRISGSRAKCVLRKLKFPKWHVADPVGFAGGIWLNWDDAAVQLTIIISSPQLVHALVKPKDQEEFMLTVVYASPKLEVRRILWTHMEDLARTITLPWVVLGDFNDVLNGGEKMGGFYGPAFTWCNRRKGLRKIQERLDRVLARLNWRVMFPEAAVIHLPRVHSDHNPVLLRLEPHVPGDKSQRPFRFQAMWRAECGFDEMMSKLWRELDGSFVDRTEKLASALLEWNKADFGNIFAKKKELRARINGVQRALAVHRSHQLELLEEDLVSQYDKILEKEELFWAQNSRVQWIMHGDRNTNFFHFSTVIRRRRNKILLLRDATSGEWVSDQGELMRMVVAFFRNLFSIEDGDVRPLGIVPHPVLSPVDVLNMDKRISLAEVRSALFQMKPWKAPGVDGFQAGVYQAYWDDFGTYLYQLVLEAFDSGSFSPELNRTLLVLIPKVQQPEYVKQFRPISLCTVAYKLITKVLVNRLRPLLDNLVGPLQSSFIPGHQAADNVFIAQEMIHTIRRSRSKLGLMAIKIDLEKAYDRVRWDFLRDTLIVFGFPDSWVQLIMYCVESSSMSVMWNGEKTDFFSPDDLFLFGRASEKQAETVREVLDRFCLASGAEVSLEKSRVFISPKASGSNVRLVSNLLGIGLTNDLGKYLGIPLVHKKVGVSLYRELIDKVATHLSGWKAKLLNMAGRATLVSSVMSSIPTYTMLTTKLPASCRNKLDMLNRRFLWGGTENKKALHLVSWDEVCKPKKFGGLGLRQMEYNNRVLLQKTAWRFLHQPHSLWVQCLCAKYRIQGDVFYFIREAGSRKASWSSSWKGLAGALEELFCGLKKRVGRGDKENFGLEDCSYANIWSLRVPLRWIFFLWLVWRGRIVTNALRYSWGISSSAICSSCNGGVEDIIHVLRDCVWAKQGLNLKNRSVSQVTLFVTTIWRIWTSRCRRVFDPNEVASLDAIVYNIAGTTKSVIAAMSMPSPPTGPTTSISWTPPGEHFVKLNTDGAAKGNPGAAGAGGVIRNTEGGWVVGFAAHLGTCSNVAAELHALRLGLTLAWREGFRAVICEVDAKVILDLLNSDNLEVHPLGALLLDVKEMLSWNWQCFCQHTLREGNFCADMLSKMGCDLATDMEFFYSPPSGVVDIFEADRRGVAFPRGFKFS
ncbi:reverse transcriptase [Corchorus capsularis]|uniref:Reverse transcriptase n=1 Tax=Corchorus capsularis TaxID=210143 RepID=A0A1R3J823_COCAP|nr:reverse transcriptase [Corchorus capsularis]